MNDVLEILSLMSLCLSMFALGYVWASRNSQHKQTHVTMKGVDVHITAHIDTERNAMEVIHARWEIKP